MSVADLGPGDKLSLKGKIFELQKKLNLVDVEQQNTKDYSFEPEITNYKLPHRENNFIANMKRAEESRKEKLESLKEMVMLETGADFSYKPTINKASRSLKSDQPAYVRLREKGKEYQSILEKKKVDAAIFDSNGRKLFVPQRHVRKTASFESEMDVDEYLYRDAQGRAERRQQNLEEDSREIAKLATEKKINKKSELLVKRKSERELRLIFETLLNLSKDDSSESVDSNPYVTITEFQKLTEEIQRKYSQKMKEFKKLKSTGGNVELLQGLTPQKSIITAHSDPYGIVDKIWKIIDPNEVGYVHVQTFVTICLPVLINRGGQTLNILASSSPSVISDYHSDISSYSDQSLLYQYLSALTSFITTQHAETTTATATSAAAATATTTTGGATTTATETHKFTTPPRLRGSLSNSINQSNPVTSPGSTSSNTIRQDIPHRVVKYNDILTQREAQTKLRMEELRYQLYEEEMRECTFRPQITEVASKLSYYPPAGGAGGSGAGAGSGTLLSDEDSHSFESVSLENNLNLPAYERLYQQKNKIPKSIKEKRHPTREERELEGCTFTPQTFSLKKQLESKHEHKGPTGGAGGRGDGAGRTNTSLDESNQIKEEGDEEDEKDRRDYGIERQSSEETYEKLNELSTKNSIIEIMIERQQHQHRHQQKSILEESQSSNHTTHLPPPPPPPPPPEPKGFTESVQRIRNALEKKKQKETEELKVFEFNEERYLKKKQQLATEGCKPFRLRTEERQNEKTKIFAEAQTNPNTKRTSTIPNSPVHALKNDQMNSSSPSSLKGYVRREDGELKPVRLYVEIKLGGGVKAAHIAVADYDIPSELAKSFCRIYSLDSNAEGILTEVVTNQMIQSGIPIGTSPIKPTKSRSRMMVKEGDHSGGGGGGGGGDEKERGTGGGTGGGEEEQNQRFHSRNFHEFESERHNFDDHFPETTTPS